MQRHAVNNTVLKLGTVHNTCCSHTTRLFSATKQQSEVEASLLA